MIALLTQRHRVAIRRHLGVPFANTAQAGRLFGWRFAIHNEDLEYKMSNMSPPEEQLITGNAMGSWQIIGDNATIGDVLTFNIVDSNTISPIQYVVTYNDLHPAANIINPTEASQSFSIALNAAQAINAAANQFGYSAVAAMPANAINTQYLPPYFSEVILTFGGLSTATLGASVSGTTHLVPEQQMTNSPVAATINSTSYYGYVNVLDQLAMLMAQSDLSLTYEKADVVTFRRDEVSARAGLYRTYCEMLSRDMGGKAYVDHFFGGGGAGAIA